MLEINIQVSRYERAGPIVTSAGKEFGRDRWNRVMGEECFALLHVAVDAFLEMVKFRWKET